MMQDTLRVPLVRNSPNRRWSVLTHRTEGDANRADQDFRRDGQAVENAPEEAGNDVRQGWDRTTQGVEDVPKDIGGMLEGAASKIGDFTGGAQNEGRRAEQGVQNDYGQASGDVEGFGQGEQNSFDQGKQQGQQQGW